MARQLYEAYTPQADAKLVISRLNTVIAEYLAARYTLTVRQLYYQLIARDLLPDTWIDPVAGTKNNVKNYKKIVNLLGKARMGGMIDWNAIEDRVRNLETVNFWGSPQEIMEAVAGQFKLDLWANQPYYIQCFPGYTNVITFGSVRPIAHIMVGDSIIQDDGSTGTVTEVFKREFHGSVIRVKATGLPSFDVTPEHPFYVKQYDSSKPGYWGARRKFNPDMQWVKARDLKRFDYCVVPRTKVIADIESIEITGTKRSKGYTIALDEHFCGVLGMYLAEGNIRPDRGTLQFTMEETREDQDDLISSWADRYGLHVGRATGPGTRIIYISNKPLVLWIKDHFGSGAFEKHIPQMFMTLPFSKQLALLEWYIRADGHVGDVTRSCITVGTRSEILARQCQILLIRLGYGAHLHSVTDHDKPMWRVAISGEHGVRLANMWAMDLPFHERRYNHILVDDNFAYFPIKSTEEVPFIGDVYNLEVSDRHTYCVPVVAHNCWVEKESLSGVMARACTPLRVPWMACKGYMSLSEIRAQGLLLKAQARDKDICIIHLGDHDPSGIAMTQDIIDRLSIFAEQPIEVLRIALNMDQVEQYNPPTNPAKEADPRFEAYQREFGDESWELDALSPPIITQLITDSVNTYRDQAAWATSKQEEEYEKSVLKAASDNWDWVKERLVDEGYVEEKDEEAESDDSEDEQYD
jgi:hypothetical protein